MRIRDTVRSSRAWRVRQWVARCVRRLCNLPALHTSSSRIAAGPSPSAEDSTVTRFREPAAYPLRVVALSEVPDRRRRQIAGPSPALSAAPRDAHGQPRSGGPWPRTDDFSAIELREYENVLLRGTRRTGLEVDGFLALTDDLVKRGYDPPASGSQFKASFKYIDFVGIDHSPGKHHVVAQPPTAASSVTAGHYLGGFALSNWYHWLTSGLFRAWLLDTMGLDPAAFPHLVPASALSVGPIVESLHVLRRPTAIVPMDGRAITRVGRLAWITPFSEDAEFADPDGAPRETAFHAAAIHQYRDALNRTFGPIASRSSGLPTRVFLDRGPADSRSYNREQVLRIAGRFGFTPVSPERLSIREQAELFGRASAIIGPSGAAWANLLFASSELRALYWLPDFLSGSQTWATLAAASGCSIRELTCATPEGASFFRDRYELALNDLTACLEQL